MYKQWQTGTSQNSALVITLPVVLKALDCTLSVQDIKCFTSRGLVSTSVTGHAGPEGSRKLRLLDFLTTAQYGGRLSALRTGCLYPQGYAWYSFSLGAESTPGPWSGPKEICH